MGLNDAAMTCTGLLLLRYGAPTPLAAPSFDTPWASPSIHRGVSPTPELQEHLKANRTRGMAAYLSGPAAAAFAESLGIAQGVLASQLASTLSNKHYVAATCASLRDNRAHSLGPALKDVQLADEDVRAIACFLAGNTSCTELECVLRRLRWGRSLQPRRCPLTRGPCAPSARTCDAV